MYPKACWRAGPLDRERWAAAVFHFCKLQTWEATGIRTRECAACVGNTGATGADAVVELRKDVACSMKFGKD